MATVVTDASWKALHFQDGSVPTGTSVGPSGWNDTGFDDSSWAAADETTTPYGFRPSYDIVGAATICLHEIYAHNYQLPSVTWGVRKTFTIAGTPAAGTLWINADDQATFWINGTLIDTCRPAVKQYDVSAALQSGSNVIAIQVSDTGLHNNWQQNPTWTQARLEVDSEPAPPPLVTPGIAIDIYDVTGGTQEYVATVENHSNANIRVEKDGTGTGAFTINRWDAQATKEVLGDPPNGDTRLCKVRVPAISSEHIFGFWLEDGAWTLLDDQGEEGGEEIEVGGRGVMAYLEWDIMAHHSYLTTPFVGMDPYGGIWRLYAAGTGNAPGQILERVLQETQETGRPWHALPLLTYGAAWDYTEDSDGNAWSTSDASDEFQAQIGETILSVVGRLIGTGDIHIYMSPHLELTAYNVAGRDLTGAAFGPGVVRFVRGVNVADRLVRQMSARRPATHELVGGDNESFAVAELPDAASRMTKATFISAMGEGATALEGIGLADLQQRLLRGESITINIALGHPDDPVYNADAGFYFPTPAGLGGDFWVGDLVRLHTGSADFDVTEADLLVAALTIAETDAVALDSEPATIGGLRCTVELNSPSLTADPAGAAGYGGGTSAASAGGGGSGTVPTHSHPGATIAWKQPCRVATTGNVTIATALNAGDTVDGETLVAGWRVLVRAQTDASENGIYDVGPTPTRSADMDASIEILGAAVRVVAGATLAGKAYVVTNETAPTIGVDDILVDEWAGGVTDHGALSGLGDDDHTQYVELADDIAIEIVLDGGGSAIATGVKCDISLPFTGHVRGWRLLGDANIVVDVWKDTYANFPPVVGDSMVGAGTKPTLSGVTKNEAYPTNWTTTAFTAGDVLRINVDSATATLATLSLTVDRT